MKKCPFCAEEIQDEAILCKKCGKSLIEPHWKKYVTRLQALDDHERGKELLRLSPDQLTQYQLVRNALGYNLPTLPKRAMGKTLRLTLGLAGAVVLLVALVAVVIKLTNSGRLAKSTDWPEIAMEPIGATASLSTSFGDGRLRYRLTIRPVPEKYVALSGDRLFRKTFTITFHDSNRFKLREIVIEDRSLVREVDATGAATALHTEGDYDCSASTYLEIAQWNIRWRL